MHINLHSFLERSTENGPGTRAVIWVQGCTLNCPGCFNPDTHDSGTGTEITVAELAEKILKIENIEGITISGGEPFLQAAALAELGRIMQRNNLGVVVFTGFTLEELQAAKNPDYDALLNVTDLLIDGPFIQALICNLPLRGSSNQRLFYLSDRYTSLQATLESGANSVEILIDPSGDVIITGFPTEIG